MTDQVDIPRFASGVTAIHGLSGAGKSALADSAAEYVAERYGQGTMCIAPDPGGWGNHGLSLIRAGVMKVYDPTNHVNFFETLEALSLGAFPETVIDPDRGYADPHVKLLLPRQPLYVAKCPNGHEVGRFFNQAIMLASSTNCPTCGVVTNSSNQTTQQLIVKPALFAKIGLRIFDSITALNDRGLALELPGMSARGELPTSRGGGSALGSADAIRQGTLVLGTGSEAQVGFMQNRTYGWLTNIRTIPDQVIGAICTFGTEESKDDARGGELCYGPAIAGKARTARVPGWVGNCLHATKEPDEAGRMRYRLWLTNHIDPRDISKRPYLAKHRGTPLGMPDFLEDPWSDDAGERAKLAWSVCSLKHFFELLERQYAEVSAADALKFASFKTVAAATDEVLATATVPTAVMPALASSPVIVGGGRSLRPVMPVVPTSTVVATPAPSPNGGAATMQAGSEAVPAAMPTTAVVAPPVSAPAVVESIAAPRLRRPARPPVS